MIAMSACLAGIACRYDGKEKGCAECKARILEGDVVLICPEVMGGLPTPRPPAELPGGDAQAVWAGESRIVNRDGRDVTEEYLAGAEKVAALCREHGIQEVWLKAKSPACGCGWVYDGSFTGRLTEGDGILACRLKKDNIKIVTIE